jgi:UDP-N-acetylglucosamine 2-epimerase (non-hydrolysing)
VASVSTIKIVSVVGARPNFMKAAPFLRAIERHNLARNGNRIVSVLVHTGQHYDSQMSASFFRELCIPEPNYNLGIGSGSHAEQVGLTMIAFEKLVLKENPDWVVVFGDINATLACSLVSRKVNIRVCHIEAGLRSGDMTMPEEVNRILTDRISDLLLTPDRQSLDNLIKEGINSESVNVVGNIMIDTLDFFLKEATELNIPDIITSLSFPYTRTQSGITELANSMVKYGIITLHRPSNVDDPLKMNRFVEVLKNILQQNLIILWPVHPRTKKNLQHFNLLDSLMEIPGLVLLNPASYLQMLKLLSNAAVLLTDSGGLQAESTVLGVPCLTLRKTTEWVVTLEEYGGTSVLTEIDPASIRSKIQQAFLKGQKPFRPPLWNGNTADLCLDTILRYKQSSATIL